LTIGEQNVVKIEEPKVDETSNQCNLKWTWWLHPIRVMRSFPKKN
jgi:hypothetical protein